MRHPKIVLPHRPKTPKPVSQELPSQGLENPAHPSPAVDLPNQVLQNPVKWQEKVKAAQEKVVLQGLQAPRVHRALRARLALRVLRDQPVPQALRRHLLLPEVLRLHLVLRGHPDQTGHLAHRGRPGLQGWFLPVRA